jgi:trehalose 6-phosphate synthase/phosphatase
MGRLILISNRLPVTTVRTLEKEDFLAPSAGGLVAGLGPIHESGNSLWIGSLAGEIDDARRAELEKSRLIPISLPRERARRHYEGYSNGVLWPLCHYFLESIEYDPQDFEAYRSVNERFADTVARHARPGDHIWVHDYHLMLLPMMLRERIPGARIGFFLHVPFPSSEVFRVLPQAEQILKGLAGADLIGLHTFDYVRHLATAYRRICGSGVERGAIEWEGGRCHIRALPLGVDAKRFAALAATPGAERRLTNWRRRTAGRQVVLGVDRLDYSKGLLLRLEAYHKLLREEPLLRKSVVFLQLCVPTRSAMQQYSRLKQQVEQRVGEINGEFGELGRMPIHYMYRSVPPEEVAALYRLADVAMVTPLRDGMNLVAKEYIASRQDNSGVLVLSEFAGAATELGEALVVNPWDLDGTAQAVARALRMDAEEQGGRMSALRRRVAENTAQRWARSFLEALDDCADEQEGGSTPQKDEVWKGKLARSLASARRALIVLDYDGTLREFDADPANAHPDEQLSELLRRLCMADGIEVIILSGRDRESLDKWFGRLPAHLVAEYGYFLRTRKGRRWEELVSGVDRSWFVGVGDVMESYVARTPGSFIERKHSGLSWHYRKAEAHLGQRQARELAHHLTEYFANRPLRVQHGACVVEAHGQEIDKGWTYRTLLNRLGSFDFVLVAGDDRTDEDLFEAVAPSAWSIKIGTGPSAARHRLASPDLLRTLLASALARREKKGLGRGFTPDSSAGGGQQRRRTGIAPPGLPVGFTQDGLGDT